MPKLTKRMVDRVTAGDRDIVLWDDDLPRFGLRVKPSGAMTYVVQYRNSAGRTRKLALGRVGEIKVLFGAMVSTRVYMPSNRSGWLNTMTSCDDGRTTQYSGTPARA